MPTDLSSQIRALVDQVQPVSASEAIARAESYPSALEDLSSHRHRHGYRPAAVAASAIILAGAGVGWAISSKTSSPVITRGGVVSQKHQPKVVLTDAQVKAIAVHSSAAAASSGTAQVTETSSDNGKPQDGYDTAVTFDGSNIDEKITSVPEPPGSERSFTTDDRFVDGQFYIYTPGPGDVLEWLHDTNSASDAASMQFPDPRTLYDAISPGARFEVESTKVINGVTLTELRALDPGEINTNALGNLVQGSLKSFRLTIDENDVVQQMAFSSADTVRACRFDFTSSEQRALKAELRKEANTKRIEGAVSIPAFHAATRAVGIAPNCGPETTSSQVTVDFANLGAPQAIAAPGGAIDFAGKG